MSLSATNDGAAGALFQSTVQAVGVDVSHLSAVAQLQLAVASIYADAPPGSVAAGDIAHGTFGANIPDTGDYVFPSGVAFGTLVSSTTAIATPSALAATAFNAFTTTVSGAVLMGFGTTWDVGLKQRSGTTAAGVLANSSNFGFVSALISTTALATPSALAATAFNAFASTVSGATLMGFGTTGDVTLKNRSGTDVFVVTANSVNATLAGMLTMADALVLTGSVAAPSIASRWISASGSAVNLVANVPTGGLFSLQVNGGSYFQSAADRAGVRGALTIGETSTVAATASSATKLIKATSAFSDGVAKATITITIPNAAHSASVRVRVTGSLGAGGAIGANEASASNSYMITIARTAGVNAVAAISSAFGAAAAAVAGAATVTCTAAMSAVSGAVGATNTFTVNVTITRSGGASDNHTCVTLAEIVNANATGVTIS